HRFTAQMEVRLKVFEDRVLLQHRETFRLCQRVRWNVEESVSPNAGEPNEITSLLRFLTFLVKPNADFRARCDLFADGVNVLVPRNLFARQDQFSRAWPEQVVSLADGPLHQ